MSAASIGPAIWAMGELVGRTSRVLYGDELRIRAEVQADFRRASFGIEFFLTSVTVGILPSVSLQDLANVAEVLGVAGTGVIGLLKWQRGRKIDRVEPVGDRVNVTIQNTTVNVSAAEFKVYMDPDARGALKTIVAPLNLEGVDSLELRAENKEPTTIIKAEAESIMDAPLPDEEVGVTRGDAILEIVGVSFREGNKWRFSQGTSTFYADIEDEAFLERVAKKREVFGAGDALRVVMETTTTRRPEGGFEFRRKILEVVEHIPAPPPMRQERLL